MRCDIILMWDGRDGQVGRTGGSDFGSPSWCTVEGKSIVLCCRDSFSIPTFFFRAQIFSDYFQREIVSS